MLVIKLGKVDYNMKQHQRIEQYLVSIFGWRIDEVRTLGSPDSPHSDFR